MEGMHGMVFLAAVPLLLPFVLMLALRQNGLRTSVVSCLVTLLVAGLVQQGHGDVSLAMGALSWRAAGQALAIGFGVLSVLFPGLLLYRLQERCGALPVIAAQVRRYFRQRALQVLALTLGISPFVEAVSGFGVSLLIVVPLLVQLGFSPLSAGRLALLSQVSVQLGALAVGTLVGAQLAGLPVDVVGAESLALGVPLPALFGLAALGISGGWPAVRRFWPVAVVVGLTKGLGDQGLTRLLGVEVAGALASLLALVAAFMLAMRIRAQSGDEPLPSGGEGAGAALAPYGFLIIALLLTRGIGPLRQWLQQQWVFDPFGAGYDYPLLYVPGFWVLLAALSVLVFHRLPLRAVLHTTWGTWQQFWPAGLTILFFLMMAQVMSASGMAAEVARAGSALGHGYLAMVPVLGALGGWLTGSNTGGNAMFVPLQVSAAQQVGLPVNWVVAAQNATASYATIGSPARVALVAATLSDRGVEAPLLAAMLRYVLLATLVIGMGLAMVVRVHPG